MPTDFAALIATAKANGYYNYVEPFWTENERLCDLLREALCWLPLPGGKTPEQRGAKMQFLSELEDRIIMAVRTGNDGQPLKSTIFGI